MVLPQPSCVYCTLKNGVYISQDDGSTKELVNLEDKFINATCHQNFQCAYAKVTETLPHLGCCYPCSHEQACLESTVSLKHPFYDNICPNGFVCNPQPQRCSVGEICFKNTKLDCHDVQLQSQQLNFGNIFDGMYCEEGSAAMTYCPTGYYCPTARDKIVCPSDYYCPMKTQIPEIKCSKCIEGSTKRVRDYSFAMVVLYIFVIIFTLSKSVLTHLRRWCKVDKAEAVDDCMTENFDPTNEKEKGLIDIEIRYDNLSLTLPDNLSPFSCMRRRRKGDKEERGGIILKNVSGTIKPGRLVGLFGASGAGKSSLLKLLSGRCCKGNIGGALTINGVEVKCNTWNRTSSHASFKSLIAFIPQDDTHLQMELTVNETLFWAARFHMKSSNYQVKKRIQSLMKSLNLEHIQYATIGDISGGERRRVSIGVALAAKPRVLISDEITSGLDSNSSMTVMRILKNLANDGISVVTSLHQAGERLFAMLDDLILLQSKGGEVIYNGESKKAMGYFRTQGSYDVEASSSLNPADILVDISTSDSSNQSVSRIQHRTILSHNNLKTNKQGMTNNIQNISNSKFFRKSASSQFISLSYKSERPCAVVQFYYQVQRNCLLIKRNLKSKVIDTGVIILCSSIISLVEENSLVHEHMEHAVSFTDIESKRLPLLQMFQLSLSPCLAKQEFAIKMSLLCGMLVALAASRSIASKRVQTIYETHAGYDLTAYFLGISTVSLIEHGFQMFFAAVISYWIILPLQPLLCYCIHFCLLSFVMQAWGQLLAIVLSPESMTILLGAILLCLNLLLSGVARPFTFADIYKNPKLALFVGLLSPTRYFVEALVVSDVICLPYQFGFTKPVTNSTNIEFTALDVLGLAQNDKGIQKSCNGWYYAVPRLFVTGMMLRVLALFTIHFSYAGDGRGMFQLLKGYSNAGIAYLLILLIALVSLFLLNVNLILT